MMREGQGDTQGGGGQGPAPCDAMATVKIHIKLIDNIYYDFAKNPLFSQRRIVFSF